MNQETRVALANYDWLVKNKRANQEDLTLLMEIDTIVYGDGGATIDVLLQPGFTPATDGPEWR